jgi:hypothetical protein
VQEPRKEVQELEETQAAVFAEDRVDTMRRMRRPQVEQQ